MVTQHYIGKLRSQPRERCPGFHKWVGVRIHAIEMIGNPQRIEMWQRGRQDVLLLKNNNRLMVAPPIADDR